jgi:lipid-A-disaccharide synthase
VVALLPGSRQGELEQMADLFVGTAVRVQSALPEARFLVPLVTRETRELFEAAIYRHAPQAPEFTLLFGHAHDALRAADVALVASGTATLEAALLGCPMVITYRVPAAAARAYRLLRRAYLPYVGLPNILAGEFVVPELLQEHATAENLAQALLNLYRDDVVRERIRARFAAIAGELRRDGARAAAREVLPFLEAQHA